VRATPFDPDHEPALQPPFRVAPTFADALVVTDRTAMFE
jgi:hypothetical protein